MPIARVAIFVLVAGLLAPVAAHAASLDEQVKAAYTAWDAAFNKSDAKAVTAFYADDAVLLASAGTERLGQYQTLMPDEVHRVA